MDETRWLLLDSCGSTATMAVGRGTVVLGSESMVGRAFSAEWPAALRRLMSQMAGLDVVGVVHGPGSFTGVRVGLAVAKGLCEVSGARMVALSRLAVLQTAGGGVPAVLDAGRKEFYVRELGGERLCGPEELRNSLQAAVTADAAVAAELGLTLVHLSADAALPLLLERVRTGAFDDIATSDANYVRGEREIYPTLQVSGVGQ